jgi:hypothetical protein
LSSLFFLMFCLFLMKRISIMNIKLSNSLTRASLIKLLLSFQKDCFHRDHLDEITKDIENTHKYHVRFLFCWVYIDRSFARWFNLHELCSIFEINDCEYSWRKINNYVRKWSKLIWYECRALTMHSFALKFNIIVETMLEQMNWKMMIWFYVILLLYFWLIALKWTIYSRLRFLFRWILDWFLSRRRLKTRWTTIERR